MLRHYCGSVCFWEESCFGAKPRASLVFCGRHSLEVSEPWEVFRLTCLLYHMVGEGILAKS